MALSISHHGFIFTKDCGLVYVWQNERDTGVDALKMALFKRKIAANMLLHSDRGSQYASESFQQLLRDNRIECSMSRKGDCWDNAAMESFFHSLKTECVYHERYLTRDEARKSVFDYIEVFYNRQRKHPFLGYKSPEQHELASGF